MELKLSDIFEYMKQIDALLEEKIAKRMESEPEDPYQSPQTNELITSFAKAQTEYPRIGNNKINPFFKSEFADYNSIMSEVRPVLSKNGLVLTQYTVINKVTGERLLHSRLMHSSGQWIETREKILPEKNDDQKWASTVTFKKRHQAMALLNITIDKDKYDDDAEENMRETRMNDANGTRTNHNYTTQDQTYQSINAHQYGELNMLLKGWPDLCKAILTTYKISTLADLPIDKYDHVKNQVLKNIEQRSRGTKPVQS